MADIRDFAAKAFQEIHPNNPRNKLNDSDRKILWALLMAYAHASRTKHGGKAKAFFEEWDSMSKTVADAAKLGARLKSQIFGGTTSSQALVPFAAGFEDLPMRLIVFSKTLGEALDSFGKPGHKDKVLVTQGIQASEFVYLKTGQHYDEHLAELFQAIGKRSAAEDLSRDAIRKKRERLKEHYPVLYANAVKRAKRKHEV